ncbi:DUF6093 family protein [Nonomuraea angiospora]|uniref:DUF6093 family protein n=1 Tax=Nonomuraea angiospora TaxID=46172 RepID=UPI0034352C00
MALQDALAGARELVPDVVFEDQVLIERKTGTSYTDPETLEVVEEYATVYEGSCKVAPLGAGRDATYGEGEVVLHRYRLKIPWSASTPVRPKDRATITESPDGWAAGRVLEVVDVDYKSTAVTRKLIIEDRA